MVILYSFSGNPKSAIENLKSFNDLVRPHQHLRRNAYANLFSCPEINHELKLRRLLEWNVGRLGAFQDLIDKVSDASEHVPIARSVAHQSAGLDKFARCVNRGQPVLFRE